MSWQAAKWAEARSCSRSAKLVLLILANASSKKPVEGVEGIEAFQCNLSHQTLARRAGVSVDTTQRAVGELEDRGLVARRLRYDANGRRTSSVTFLNTEGEPADQFRDRLGCPECAGAEGATKPQAAAKVGSSLGRKEAATKPQRAPHHYVEMGAEPGERGRRASAPELLSWPSCARRKSSGRETAWHCPRRSGISADGGRGPFANDAPEADPAGLAARRGANLARA